MTCVDLCGLGKVFPNGVEAVAGVSLTVESGEFLAVVGPSGSGKSTLLRLIAGLETPSTGSIAVGGRDVSGKAPGDRGLAMVFQDPALYPYLSVFDNLAFGLRARGVGRAEVKDRVESVAATLGISGLLGRRPETLSGGERRRVALGRAVARRPSVFLFDEPLSGLDAPLRAQIRGDLKGLHRALGATMLYVTHDQGEALALGDRVAVMNRGRVEQVGTPRAVYERPASRFVSEFIGNPPMRVIRCRVEAGDGPLRVELEGGASSLEVPEGPWAAPVASRRGSGVGLGLRPEHVAIARESGARDPAWTWLSGTFEVERVEYLGHESVVTLRVGAGRLDARIPEAEGVRSGERFGVGVDLRKASWFDTETGAAFVLGSPVL